MTDYRRLTTTIVTNHPPESDDHADLVRLVVAARLGLPSDHLKVISVSYIILKSIDPIAKALDKADGTVKIYTHNGKWLKGSIGESIL